jgi:hypothetical protein
MMRFHPLPTGELMVVGLRRNILFVDHPEQKPLLNLSASLIAILDVRPNIGRPLISDPLG